MLPLAHLRPHWAFARQTQDEKRIFMQPDFSSLLYRYFFFSWLFMDVDVRDIYSRAAAWRHNKLQARWLPIYIQRYIVLGVIFLAIGYAFEHSNPILSAFFYVPGVMTVPMSTVAGVAWLGFRFWH